MLFRKKMPRSCAHCAHGTAIAEEQVLCTKCGVVSATHQCRKFHYDPCKRIPPKPKAPNFSKYDNEDFSL